MKSTWFKSPKNQLLSKIMTQINHECMSWCFLHFLKQTKSKYGEALVHSSGLSKHGTFLMWKIVEMRKICLFFFSQNFYIELFINSLLQNVTVGTLVYSPSNFVMLWCVCLSQYWIWVPYPQIQEHKNSCLNP